MEKCMFCGKQDVKSHTKYKDRCDTCGKRYARYTSYMSKQRKEYNASRDAILADIIAEYRKLMEEGYKVPAAIKRGEGLI